MSITTRGWGDQTITTVGWGGGVAARIRRAFKRFTVYIVRRKEIRVARS